MTGSRVLRTSSQSVKVQFKIKSFILSELLRVFSAPVCVYSTDAYCDTTSSLRQSNRELSSPTENPKPIHNKLGIEIDLQISAVTERESLTLVRQRLGDGNLREGYR